MQVSSIEAEHDLPPEEDNLPAAESTVEAAEVPPSSCQTGGLLPPLPPPPSAPASGSSQRNLHYRGAPYSDASDDAALSLQIDNTPIGNKSYSDSVDADDDYDDENEKKAHSSKRRFFAVLTRCAATLSSPKKLCLTSVLTALLYLLANSLFAPASRRIISPAIFDDFLFWVQTHPAKGLAAYVVVYALHVVLLLPGTPLTMGGGFVFKRAYGWTAGVLIGSLFSLLGSFIGGVTCFLLGRYLLRDVVRRVIGRKYPLFDAIDAAVSDNGFKIMSLLYLTPIVPLGPVSYMIGTTSMPLASFAMAKIAALPLTALYVFIGASTGTLVSSSAAIENAALLNLNAVEKEVALNTDVGIVGGEVSQSVVVTGMLLSIASIGLITFQMKKELQKILDQKKQCKEDNSSHKHVLPGRDSPVLIPSGTDDSATSGSLHPRNDEKVYEVASQSKGGMARHRRQNWIGSGGSGAAPNNQNVTELGGVDDVKKGDKKS